MPHWSPANIDLPASGVSAGSYGDSTHVGVFTVDAAGRITAASSVAIAGAASPLTTKGDLWGYSTTNARVPVGSNGQVLTADSSQALGLKWATPTTGVTMLDAITGAVTLVAGSGITITDNSPAAGSITIAATGGGSGTIYAPLTNPHVPDLIFDSTGDVIMAPD